MIGITAYGGYVPFYRLSAATANAAFGKKGGKQYLTVGYGVYGETTRSDNDYQVLLQYDVRNWAKYEKPLSQDNMHQQGPAKPAGQYFVKTGNTTYGVQNVMCASTTVTYPWLT